MPTTFISLGLITDVLSALKLVANYHEPPTQPNPLSNQHSQTNMDPQDGWFGRGISRFN